MTWTRLDPLEGKNNPCLCCPPILKELSPDAIIAVGFGCATLECDGEVVIDGERAWRDGNKKVTCADAEVLAARDPDHDWRIILYGPLHGEVYQRQDGKWLLVEKNQGFA